MIGVALRKAEHYRLAAAFVACLSTWTTAALSEPVRSANEDAAALKVDSGEGDARVASKKPALANKDSAALKVDSGEGDARVASKKPALTDEDRRQDRLGKFTRQW